MMTKEQAWELIKNGPDDMDEVIESIQLDAERSGYERGVREASEAFGWVLAEDARKSILSLLTKKEDAK